MPAVFENLGVRLLFPENWAVLDMEETEWPRSVTLQSPSTGFWTLLVYPPEQEAEALTKDVVKSIQDSFPDSELEVLPVTETFCDLLSEGADVTFFYLDLLVEAKVRVIEAGDATYLFHYQGESRDFDELEPVFRAIATSMLKPNQRAST